MIPEHFKELMKSLTEVEELYFRVMWAKYGVLFITAKPGVAKSAIARSIADKMGFQYFDIRLSMVDETDVGLFPTISEEPTGVIVDGSESMMKVLDHVVPRWAVNANSKPTIIHFEELNRASQSVRNAALQLLLEREIGTAFKFNDNVLMMSSGNLGDEDCTDVEEFDAALNNRLIHYKHTLNIDQWLEGFANEHVHKSITGFLTNYPENLYKFTEDNPSYATPRSWTMLSELIVKNYGKDSSPREFLPLLTRVSQGYVGNAAIKFIKYCQDLLNINIQDVLDRYDEIKNDLKKYNRDKSSELIQALSAMDIRDLNKKQTLNAVKFLKTVGEDELTGYLLSIIDDNNTEVNDKKIKDFLLHFKDLLVRIQEINNPEDQDN
jgi:hypothetical protein